MFPIRRARPGVVSSLIPALTLGTGLFATGPTEPPPEPAGPAEVVVSSSIEAPTEVVVSPSIEAPMPGTGLFATGPTDLAAAPPGLAEVVVRVAGQRQGDPSGVSSAGVGVTLALYPAANSQIPANLCRSESLTTADQPCVATTDAEGVAVFQVAPTPISLWVSGFTDSAHPMPAGWSFPESFWITDAAHGAGWSSQYEFVLPPLVAGHSYYSGVDFMAYSEIDRSSTDSGGDFVLVRENPPMPTTCHNLNVALIIDRSSSVTESGEVWHDVTGADGVVTYDNDPVKWARVGHLAKDPAKAFIDSFVNTSMSIQVFSFGATASQDTQLIPVTPSGATILKRAVDELPYLRSRLNANAVSNGPGPVLGQSTNWDEALWLAAGARTDFDMAIVFTDGLPTVHGLSADGTAALGGSGNTTRVLEMERATLSANALKAQQTHIEVVGIENGEVRLTDAVRNLTALSDASAVSIGGFEHAADLLKDTILQNCKPAISVTKYVETWDPQTEEWTEPELAGGWDFQASDWVGLAPFGATTKASSSADGTVRFEFDLAQGTDTGSVTITEVQQEGYAIAPQGEIPSNAECVAVRAGADSGAPIEVRDVGDNGFAVDGVAAGTLIRCEVVNRELAPRLIGSAEVTLTGGYGLDYQWTIEKELVGDSRVVAEGKTEEVAFRLTPRVAVNRVDVDSTGTAIITMTADTSNFRPAALEELATIQVWESADDGASQLPSGESGNWVAYPVPQDTSHLVSGQLPLAPGESATFEIPDQQAVLVRDPAASSEEPVTPALLALTHDPQRDRNQTAQLRDLFGAATLAAHPELPELTVDLAVGGADPEHEAQVVFGSALPKGLLVAEHSLIYTVPLPTPKADPKVEWTCETFVNTAQILDPAGQRTTNPAAEVATATVALCVDPVPPRPSIDKTPPDRTPTPGPALVQAPTLEAALGGAPRAAAPDLGTRATPVADSSVSRLTKSGATSVALVISALLLVGLATVEVMHDGLPVRVKSETPATARRRLAETAKRDQTPPGTQDADR